MSWHEDLTLEVHVEFWRLAGGDHYNHLVERLWRERLYGYARFTEHRRWWVRTSAGKRYKRAASKKRMARLRTVVVAVRHCVVCGNAFGFTAAQSVATRKARTCSLSCRVRTRADRVRYRIGSEALTVAEWAHRFGKTPSTVQAHVARGESIEQALRAGRSS